MTELDLDRAVRLYCEDQLSAKDIAKQLGVSPMTVLRRLRARGIQTRDKGTQRRLDIALGRSGFVDRIRAAHATGRYNTDAYKMRGGQLRPGNERKGESHPFGGRMHAEHTRAHLSQNAKARSIPGNGSYGPDWTPELRESVLVRDGRRCRRCGRRGPKLQVHHVDMDRTNNDLTNLLTLCAACHLAFHGRREGVDEVLAAAARSAERSEVRQKSRTKKER